MLNNNLYKFEPKVKYSSNTDSSLAIVSVKSQSNLNFIPEFTSIKITNPTNNKFTICKIAYETDSNIQTNSIYLSTQTIQSLKIKMFKKVFIEPVSDKEIETITSIHLTPVNTLDLKSFTDMELWENFIKPYFSVSKKICTIGDVLILNSYGYKVKFIVSRLVDLDGKCMCYGNISSNTEFHYIWDPINSANEFYDSNKNIKFNSDTKKFEYNYNFGLEKLQKKIINNQKMLYKKESNKDFCHYLTIFTISSGLTFLFMFNLWIGGLFIIHLFN